LPCLASPLQTIATGHAMQFFYSQTGCSLASNIAILSRNIAILIGRLLWAICNRLEQIASWNSQTICKQSLWLDYKKKGSTNPDAQTIWLASLFLIVQSEALFTNLLWISTCNLFASVANCSEQSAYQNCNIAGQYCNVARKITSGLTVMICISKEKCIVFKLFRCKFISVAWQAYKLVAMASFASATGCIKKCTVLKWPLNKNSAIFLTTLC
jgi:hypothetical protein